MRPKQSNKTRRKLQSKSKTRKSGGNPTKIKKGVKFGENEIRIYDNTILPEKNETIPDSHLIPTCRDFSRGHPTVRDFPCKYRRTEFVSIDDYNDWVRINIEKNRGLNPKQRFFQIRNSLAMMGQWKRPHMAPPVPPPHMAPPIPPPMDLPVDSIRVIEERNKRPRLDMAMPRFRSNVSSRIMEGLSDDEVL